MSQVWLATTFVTVMFVESDLLLGMLWDVHVVVILPYETMN